RRSRRAQGDRLRDAIRRGLGALRRVRSVRHRPRAGAGRRAGTRRSVGLTTPSESPETARAQLRDATARLAEGMEARLPRWVRDQVGRVLDAWGRADAEPRARAEAEAEAAGDEAAARVAAELRALDTLDPALHAVTPLEIVRTAVREPTEVLTGAGVPEVE